MWYDIFLDLWCGEICGMSDGEFINIVVERAGVRVLTVPIAEGSSIVFGRGRDSDITLDDDEKQLSRRHASLSVVNGRVYADDMGSTNGTHVNSMRIRTRVQITETDSVDIGGYHLLIEIQEQISTPPQQNATNLQPSPLPNLDENFNAAPAVTIVSEINSATTPGTLVQLNDAGDEVCRWTISTTQKSVIGRTLDALIYIDDGSVSRRHAELSWNGTQWILEDCGSLNGTALNEIRVEGGGHPVHSGSSIRFGDVRTRFAFTMKTAQATPLSPAARNQAPTLLGVTPLPASPEAMTNLGVPSNSEAQTMMHSSASDDRTMLPSSTSEDVTMLPTEKPDDGSGILPSHRSISERRNTAPSIPKQENANNDNQTMFASPPPPPRDNI